MYTLLKLVRPCKASTVVYYTMWQVQSLLLIIYDLHIHNEGEDSVFIASTTKLSLLVCSQWWIRGGREADTPPWPSVFFLYYCISASAYEHSIRTVSVTVLQFKI